MRKLIAILGLIMACNGDTAPGSETDARPDVQVQADAHAGEGLHCPQTFQGEQLTAAYCIAQSQYLYCSYRTEDNMFYQPRYYCANGCIEHGGDSCNP